MSLAELSIYALLAEFGTPEDLLAAVRTAGARYSHVDAYAPYAVDGLAEALGFRRNRVPLVTLLGGIAGGAGIYFLQWYSAVIDYPINSGAGRCSFRRPSSSRSWSRRSRRSSACCSSTDCRD